MYEQRKLKLKHVKIYVLKVLLGIKCNTEVV